MAILLHYNKEHKLVRQNIIKSFKLAKFSPPKYNELEAVENDSKNFKMVFEFLVDEGVLIKVAEDCFFLFEDYNNVKELIISSIRNNGYITLAELRDQLDTSRKYAMALIEHFDNIKLTKRVEDKRVLY
jgi:selenocysteine-specific elongation factor